ncbi:MAG: citrate/2-methylcitrate synthase [Thermoplasmatales archaeon]|nr:citrate/2-methylcitrate synthase [Thermoplasmatales archaeon]MCW6170250.1 citrate/2-methylcitrate synthase [Thermoplasmatales archaeon]
MTSSNQENVQFSKGLEGIVAAESSVGYVDGLAGKLVYRGYDVNTLVENCDYEEVSYLLLNGELPNTDQYKNYSESLRKKRQLDNDTLNLIKDLKDTHPMSALRTVISFIGARDNRSIEPDLETQKNISIDLIAKIPSVVAAINRAHNSKEFIPPDDDLSFSSNFFYQALGRRPDKDEAKMIDEALILHADHGMNASTFTSMVVISTLSDMYSAVTAAISSLKGPLHGGANERALALIQRVGNPENAEKVISNMIASKEKIMGFGHRVYKVYDPRAKILKKFVETVTTKNGQENLFQTAERIENIMTQTLGSKGIFPNVDFYSGLLYYSVGFDPSIFTPIFAVGRISGWTARSLEYLSDNKIFRPRGLYVGNKGPKEFVPIDDRQ